MACKYLDGYNKEAIMSMGPSYEFPVVITRIVDGDTVDARIDIGFKIMYEERIRLPLFEKQFLKVRSAPSDHLA